MHEKYVFLHFSYSAPVRVLDIENESSFVARALTVCFFVDDVLVRGFCVVLREVVVRGVVVALRGDNVVFRGAVVLRDVVAVRTCVCCVSFSVLVRETVVPSRTAPVATPIQVSIFAAKNRIFFISGKKFTKFVLFPASE
jgi:hypothetical protein